MSTGYIEAENNLEDIIAVTDAFQSWTETASPAAAKAFIRKSGIEPETEQTDPIVIIETDMSQIINISDGTNIDKARLFAIFQAVVPTTYKDNIEGGAEWIKNLVSGVLEEVMAISVARTTNTVTATGHTFTIYNNCAQDVPERVQKHGAEKTARGDLIEVKTMFEYNQGFGK
jgi:hypothetical protein